MRTDQIHYTLQFDVPDGNMAAFEALADEAIAHRKSYRLKQSLLTE